jgi:hypothetical protein
MVGPDCATVVPPVVMTNPSRPREADADEQTRGKPEDDPNAGKP